MPQPTTPAPSLGEIWGQRIAERRALLGLSQAQLADLCGVEQQTISRAELGKTIPRDALKLAIARNLGEPMTVLFAWPEGLAA